MNRRLQFTYRKYGLEGMEWAILLEVPKELLLIEESNAIASLEACRKGLNANPTATGAGKAVSEETRRKIGLKSKGRRMSDEAKMKLRAALHKRSPETIKKAALKRTGVKRNPDAVAKTALKNTGSKRTYESRLNISKSRSTITVEQGLEIQRLYMEGFAYWEIAPVFGVNKQTICNVITRKNQFLSSMLPELDLSRRQMGRITHRRSVSKIGKRASDEARRRMSESRKGRPKSESHKAAIKAALMKRALAMKGVHA